MRLTYEQWMKDTASMRHKRSKELKDVDAALRAFRLAEQNSSGSILPQKQALVKAFNVWKTKKGETQWRSSVRNKLRAVERLDAELGHVVVGISGLSHRGELMIDPTELAAAKEVAQANKQNTRNLFQGQTLTVKNSGALATFNDVCGAFGKFRTSAKGIRTAGQGGRPGVSQGAEVEKLLVSLFGESSLPEVKMALGPVLSSDFVASVAPFIGAITSGRKALAKWGKAAGTLYGKYKMKDAAGSFAPGDPAAAFDAILRIMDREIKQHSATATIHTASAGAKAAFTAADFGSISGPAFGAAEALAFTVQKIYLFAHDWKEMKSINELLARSQYDLSLFATCPLAGAYLIANSDTSAVINMAVADYGRTGWKFEVERMVKKAQPVFDKSREVIQSSRFQFAGMQGMKGTVVDRTKKSMGLPTGKMKGVIADVEQNINRVQFSA
jgi:hypothetical protein